MNTKTLDEITAELFEKLIKGDDDLKKLIIFMSFMMLLSSCSLNIVNNDSTHQNLTSREAEDRGFVVVGISGLANIEKIENFYNDYKSKNESSVSLARYTDEGDPIYVDLDFNGEEIEYTYDNSKDKFGGKNKGVNKTTCKNIMKRTEQRGEQSGIEYYLKECEQDIGYSDKENKEYYLIFIPED
ncbi:DUF4362 domain-containing protein [Paenibacillus sp. HB172176]|uniref:DUF4362 domain-containing protein n=1 Tax=Paenibacillus sp. HB172176 TaxID=2493690 RepID=UPI0014396367|nr:DUF4362 domain-containing protein [Paenibacillus sp. HB172176]